MSLPLRLRPKETVVLVKRVLLVCYMCLVRREEKSESKADTGSYLVVVTGRFVRHV